ncbi:MAG: DMT family transporter [Lachnospiraceae bacterium]|nr:DMT family transporter [Lachnospiraceae bacterium]
MFKHKKTIMHICAFTASALWALGYVLTRVAIADFTSDTLAFLRYLIAAITLIIYALIKKIRLPKLKDVPLFIFGGAVGIAVYVYFINEGSQTLPAATVSFIVSAAPVFTALLALFLLHEKIGIKGWFSIGCAFLGVGIITYFSGGFVFSSGIIWVCISMILKCIYTIFQRKLFTRYSPLEITTYCIVAGALLLSPFAPRSISQAADASVVGLGSVFVLGVFSASMAYLLWSHALKNAKRISEATNYMFLTPILTTLLGFVMIKEAPHYSVYLGGMLVLIGVVLINYQKKVSD